jgi:tripartite-type tricarboxylate transporter receptor subunit TctC
MSKYLTALLLACAVATSAAAQTAWPDRPVKLIVGAAPGGSNDAAARALSEGMGRRLKQPVVVENKPGVGSSLATEYVLKSPADGYNILVGTGGGISVNPALDSRWAGAQTLIPVAKLTSSPLVIAVNARLGIKTVAQLIDYAKKHPGELNYAHPGLGSAPHLAALLFNHLAGVDIVPVAFKGGAPAVLSLVSGDTQVTFATPPSIVPQFQTGKIVGLAVSSPGRFSLLPDLPSMTEVGLPAFKMDVWYGLFVAANTPAPIVNKILDVSNEVMQQPEVKAAIEAQGMEVSLTRSSADFAAFVREQNSVLGKLAKESGATVAN